MEEVFPIEDTVKIGQSLLRRAGLYVTERDETITYLERKDPLYKRKTKEVLSCVISLFMNL